MNIFDIVGFGGLFFLAICWIPQTIATIKSGTISIKKSFLILYCIASILLLIQAIGISNTPLIILNAYTLVTSSINLYYGFFPRKPL